MQLPRALIVDSLESTTESKNLAILKEFCVASDFTRPLLRTTVNELCALSQAYERLYHTLVVMLWPVTDSARFQSRQIVYDDLQMQPVFLEVSKGIMNMNLLAHSTHFWSCLLSGYGDSSCVLSKTYRLLSDEQRTRPWSTRVRDGTSTLATFWRGSYAYMMPEDLVDLRNANEDSLRYADILPVDDDPDLEGLIEFEVGSDTKIFWPSHFEDVVKQEWNPAARDSIYFGMRGTK